MRAKRRIVLGVLLLLSVTVSALATEESQLVTRCKEMEKIYLAGRVPVPAGIQLVLGSRSESPLESSPRIRSLKKSAGMDVQTSIKQEWKNEAWINKSKTVTLWENPWNSKEFITSTEQHWIDGDWVNAQRYRSDYGSSGPNYTMFFEFWKDSEWQPNEKIIYEYENGLLIRQTYQISNDGGGSWRDKEKRENRYDENGFRKNFSLYMWNGIGLEEMEMYVFKNNERGQPIEERWYWILDNRYNDCVWDSMFMNMNRYKYHNTAPFSILEKVFLWEENNPRNKTLYTYADQAYWLIEVLEKSIRSTGLDGTVWYNDNRTANHYTTKSFGTVTLTYMDETLRQSHETGVWVNVSRKTITVTDIDPRYTSETISQIWSSGWQNSERELYTYELAGNSGVADRTFQAPTTYSLSNYPNPFNPTTNISFILPHEDEVLLILYDMNGRIVRMLANTIMSAGHHLVLFDGKDDSGAVMPSGIYICRLSSKTESRTKKIMMLK